MGRKVFLLIVMLYLPYGGSAQQTAQLFEEATEAYNDGRYQDAINNYKKILDSGQHSAALYFNLGNAYYKLNEIAPSIYNYEKALLLAPNDTEIQDNLNYARNMTLDAISPLPETGLSRFYNRLIHFLTVDQWARSSVILVFIFVILYLLYYQFNFSNYKRVAFIGSLISLFLAFFSMAMAYLQEQNYKSDQPAIVFAGEVEVKSEPNSGSPQAFLLHEGTKVQALDTLNSWRKIRLADGKTGWMLSEDLRLLKKF